VLSSPPVAVLVPRDRRLILGCIGATIALAWAYLAYLGHQMSSSMATDPMMAQMAATMSAPWTAADVLFTFAMWAVMMIGMMTGSAAPVLLLFGAAHAKRGDANVPRLVAMFGLGYAGVWIAFSAIAALTHWALHRAALLSPAMAASSPRVAGAILIGAGVYQLTRFKGACLTACRSPIGFLMNYWRDGAIGAAKMGWHHGLYCLGCCWALMGVLFVVGVMNLAWVAVLTAFVLAEKIGPAGAIVARVGGALMVIAGVFVAMLGGR
jgi:predicted metal-binding membrane protein